VKRTCLALFVLAAIVAPFAVSTGQSPVPPAVKPAAPADPQATLTETVGLLSGLYLYESYLNIGLLADSKAANTYEEKAVRQVLVSIITPLDAVDRQLEKIGKNARSAGDRDAVERMRAMVAMLKRIGAELTAFWDSGRAEDGAKYEASRQEAWKQISALLSLTKKQ
jgi:hypothetical protein